MSDVSAKILIVDDDELSLEFFEQVLRLERYGVAKARDGVEALDRFDRYEPDLVLLDVAMPRLNGFQVCSQLKRTARGQTVPILVLTGLDERENRRNAFQMGADDFLVKPVDRIELLARIRGLLGVRHCYQYLEQQKLALASARAGLTAMRLQLEQATAHLQLHPEPTLAPLLAEALAACNRLDQTLAAP